MIGFYFSISSLIIMIIFSFVFFGKRRVNNKETEIYGLLIIFSIIMNILEIVSCIFYLKNADINNVVFIIISKLVPISYIILNSLFCKYLMIICENNKKFFTILDILLFITIAIIFCTKTIFSLDISIC